jgi:hypothetical protein
MKVCRWTIFALLLSLFALGCTNNPAPSPSPAPAKTQANEGKIEEALAKLDPADRKLAEEQKYCAVQTEHRLGSMGKPVKVTVKEETVFVCCESCAKTALKDPDKTLAKVEDVKIKAELDKLDPADRKLAEEQKFCAISTDGRLGSMGKPIKVMLKDQPVFLCCKHCEKHAKADPDKTLAQVKKLKADNAATTPK